MISVEEASKIIQSCTIDFGKEKVEIEEAVGRVLAEPLIADRDFPPFTRVTMDGIAIQYEQFEKGQRVFPIQGVQAAGSPQQTLANSTHCLEVMTGAILPKNTDTIIRYEDVELENGDARITVDQIKPKQNAHPKGKNRKAGDKIVDAFQIISPAEIGVAASIGKTHLDVVCQSKIVILSTGDELVDIGATPLAHQIRKSNSYTLHALLKEKGINAKLLHINDDKKEIREKLSQCLETYDAILMSGGVSMGKFDFLPEVLQELGVQELFHRIRQRPGKPFWFGQAINETCVFAFPGNPVSTFMCANRYFLPWWRKNSGLVANELLVAQLTTEVVFNPDLNYFLQVKVHQRAGILMAEPIKGKGSGDLANLVDSDGFLELPAGKSVYKKGEFYSLILYR